MDERNFFGPVTPLITSVNEASGELIVSIDAQGENAADINFNVYRDGALVATGLPGATANWTDTSATPATNSHCYTLESVYTGSGHRSLHAAPSCYFGPGFDRLATIDATSFSAIGGTPVVNHGYFHYEDWGEPGDSLTIETFVPSYGGTHLIRLLAGNGNGSPFTGITCAVKLVEVFEESTLVASGYVVMPHLDAWDIWGSSSFVTADLEAGTTYTLVISEDTSAVNMSERSFFDTFSGPGGVGGRVNRANIAQVVLLTTLLQP
jgi:hypothetical protein